MDKERIFLMVRGHLAKMGVEQTPNYVFQLLPASVFLSLSHCLPPTLVTECHLFPRTIKILLTKQTPRQVIATKQLENNLESKHPQPASQ